MIRVNAGPWGHVRTTVEPDGSTFTVNCWINGQLQRPHHGLDKADANELAEELLETRSNWLIDTAGSVTFKEKNHDQVHLLPPQRPGRSPGPDTGPGSVSSCAEVAGQPVPA